LLFHFQFFSHFVCFPSSSPFFSLCLLPFISFLSTGKVLGLSPSTNLEMEQWSTRWLRLFYHQFCTQIGHVFSGIALPEFGQYSKWTHIGMDLSLLCQLLIKTISWPQKWWRHTWLNDFRLLHPENTTAGKKELSPDIKMHILLTVLYTFLRKLEWRICLNVLGDHSLYSHYLNVWTSSDNVKRNFIFVTVRA